MNHRFEALKIATTEVYFYENIQKAEFGCNVFDKEKFRLYTGVNWTDDIANNPELLDTVADGILRWAKERGATHYTHWFNPMTGENAEKHDSFLNKKGMETFSGKELLQQEPDASSFPSGGMRSTFEARGYTAWDPNSPPFVIDDTLCIPSTFISYTGVALDYKTPLLKSTKALNESILKLSKLFGLEYDNINATLGWEQEYFLIDIALYNARPDLILAGRTLFGHASAKDQQLADHYFGVIPERRLNFMRDLEYEAKKVGIPLKTRHNEVAPNQFECAPEFEEINIAIDHNQLLMYLMDKVARRHGLVALLHEKPFDKINGSGKHCNWSIQAEDERGDIKNLLSPSNPLFTTLIVNILKGLGEHNDMLRASIASASNDLRLGGHEAPPAIISAFIGSRLTEMLDCIEHDIPISEDVKTFLSTASTKVEKDNTDRNRTSPFAFTGNKFEFRAVGSSMNTAAPMIALNLIVADQVDKFVKLIYAPIDSNIKYHLKSLIPFTKKVRFEGDNYSVEWLQEAKRRGLNNITNTPEALEAFTSLETIELFEKYNVLTGEELEARKNIRLEQYVLKLQIEGRVIGDLARNHIVPVAIKYQNRLLKNVNGLTKVMGNVNLTPQNQMIKDIQKCIGTITTDVEKMTEMRKISNGSLNIKDKAHRYMTFVLPYFEKIRDAVDHLELMVDDELWPLPKYRELLFF